MTDEVTPDNRENQQSREWTAWKVWRHPRLALDALDESVITQLILEQRLHETGGKLGDCDAETERLEAEVATLRKSLKESQSELAETKKLLANALEELEELRIVDEKLAEFDRKLAKTEEMKARYEARITALKSRLKGETKLPQAIDAAAFGKGNAGVNHKFASEEDSTELIDFDGEMAVSSSIDETRDVDLASPRHADIDNIDVENREAEKDEKENGEVVLASKKERPRRNPPQEWKRKRAPGLPDDLTARGDDDWLLSLPDNL